MEHATAIARKQGKAAWYFALLVLVNLMWAGQGTAVKFLEPHLGPMAITFLPFYAATALLAPLLLRERKLHPGSPLSGRDWLRFLIAGTAGQMVAQLGMTWGITLSLASNGAILNLMIPVITAALASVLLRERITALRIACLVIGLLGAFLLSVEDFRQSSFLRTGYLAGNLLILAGTCGSAFYNVYCKGLMQRYGEIEILIFSYVMASVASLPLLLWVEPFHWSALGGLDWKAWLAFAFLALCMYGASMVLFFYVLRHLPVTVASTSLYMVPVFGVVLAVVLVGERLSGTALLGAGIVLVATVLIMKYDAASL